MTRHDAPPSGSREACDRATRLSRRERARVRLLALAVTVLLSAGACGCGSTGSRTTSASIPAYVTAPPSHEQQLISTGATLIVSDGCAACHLTASSRRLAPSFESLAGHPVMLTDGRRVIVDEAQIREALRHPGTIAIKGYNRSVMIEAVRKAHPSPADIAALAAFVEQVGPE